VNLFKKFHIQWAWLVNKRGFSVGLLIAVIILMLGFLGAVVFMLGFLHNKEGERIISSDLIQIIGGISALVLFYLYSICTVYGTSSKNFKIAINETEKFVAKNPECLLKISMLIQETRRTKDPAKLNEWINNWEKLSSVKANMQNLEKTKEEIVRGIPLKQINAEIEEKREKIEELESKLA